MNPGGNAGVPCFNVWVWCRSCGAQAVSSRKNAAKAVMPALQDLIAIVKTRRIDIIVVYKVDRLTRSLADSAKRPKTRGCRRQAETGRFVPDCLVADAVCDEPVSRLFCLNLPVICRIPLENWPPRYLGARNPPWIQQIIPPSMTTGELAITA